MTSSLYGPLISTADLDAHVRLFVDVFGMQEVDRAELTAAAGTALFGPDAGAVQLVVLETPGLDPGHVSGAVICRFEAPSTETVRTYDTRLDRDALKVIDFYAPDYEAALAHARGLGYEVVEAEAEYELEAGVFREAHLWGPDNVVTAFLGGPATFFADFAQVTGRLVSEVQSISAPLSAAQPVIDFYREVFGWDVVFEYAIDDPSFADLIGSDQALQLRSRNVGVSTREPYLGLIDYGLPAGVGGSLLGRSSPPRRGLLGAVVLTADIERVSTASGADRCGDRVPLELDPMDCHGAVVVRPPHDVPHLVLG